MPRIALMTVLLLLAGASAMAEPCNWLIDGTYCATNMGPRTDAPGPRIKFTPIESIGDDIPTGRDEVGTLGGYTFRGQGKSCIGLLRRGNCS